MQIKSNIDKIMKLQDEQVLITYIVPATRVLIWVFLSSYNLANPKSDIFGTSSESSRILLAFTSRCTIRSRDSSCKYVKPLATPIHIS